MALGEATCSEQETEETEKGKPREADGVEAEEEPTSEVKWRGQERRLRTNPPWSLQGRSRGDARELGDGSESAEVQVSRGRGAGGGGRRRGRHEEARPAPASHRELSDVLRIPAPELTVLEGMAAPEPGAEAGAMFLPWGRCGW